jgi:hypothetical protein
MKIVWERSIYFGNTPVPCAICGRWSAQVQTKTQQILLAVVYNDAGVVVGEACRSCVSLGTTGIQELIQERIASLQAQLQDLQDLAQGTVELPTLEQELEAYR